MSEDKYEIATVEDFLKVPEDKLSECLKDFASWVGMVRLVRDLGPEIVKLREHGNFVWTDDGKREANIHLHADGQEQAFAALKFTFPAEGSK